MYTITVKYLSPTNCRGARFKATCSFNRKWSLTCSYDFSLSANANYLQTALEFYNKFRYENGFDCGEIAGFGFKDSLTMVFTFSDCTATLEHGLKLLSEKSVKEVA